MIRKPLSWNVRQVCTMIQKRSITFDNPVQRPAGQWKDEDKSLLIHSLLTMFIPDVYTIQVKTENGNVYDIIDGKQRLTTICSYLDDQWPLTELPEIKLESTGELFNISGLKFSELPEVVKEEIKGCTLTFKAIELEEDDDEESLIDDIFYRLNNGKAVSKEHLALVSTPKHVQEFVRRITTEHKLYTEIAHFSANSIKKSDMQMSVLQSIVLISGKDFDSFASKDIEKFFNVYGKDITEEILSATEKALDCIADTFETKNKFCAKVNIPIIAYVYNKLEDIEQAKTKLLEYILQAKPGDCYKRYTGAGCTKKENVQGRIIAMMKICK